MIKGVLCLVLGGFMNIKKFVALLLAGALCLSAFTACSAKPEDTIASLGEENVRFDVANFLVKYQKANVEDMYTMYGMTWDVDMYGNGVTLEEEFKASAMELLHDLYTLKAHMEECGVEITAEDKAAITEAANAFLAANSENAIAEFGATQEIVEEILTLYTIQSKMYDKMIVDVDRVVSDAEANMRGYSMVTINLDGEYDENYQFAEYTEEEVAGLKEKAGQMAAQLNEKSLETVAADFGYEVSSSAYAKDDTAIDKELLTAMNALKEGEVSKIIETEDALDQVVEIPYSYMFELRNWIIRSTGECLYISGETLSDAFSYGFVSSNKSIIKTLINAINSGQLKEIKVFIPLKIFRRVNNNETYHQKRL